MLGTASWKTIQSRFIVCVLDGLERVADIVACCKCISNITPLIEKQASRGIHYIVPPLLYTACGIYYMGTVGPYK